MAEVPEGPRIRFHYGQLRLMRCTDRAELGVVSGFGYGKTTFGARWHLDRVERSPRSESIILAPTHALLEQVSMEAFINACTERGYQEGKHYTFNRSKFIIKFRAGAKVIGISGENPKRIAGYNTSHAWIDEAARCKADVRTQIVGRMRCKKAAFRQRLYTTTPEGMNWVYDLFNPDKMRREGRYSEDDGRLLLHAATYDNPYLPPDFLKSLEDTYGWDSEYFDAYVRGNWVLLSKNRFYHAFGRKNETDIAHDPSIPRFVLTWDFNVDRTSWSVMQRRSIDDKQTWIVTKVNGSNARGVHEACRQFIEAFPPKTYREHLITVYGDPSGHSRSPLTHLTGFDIIEAELKKHYPLLHIEAPNHGEPLVWERRFVANKNLANQTLLVNRGCTALLNSYRMAESDGERGIKKPKDDTITHAAESVDMALVVLDPMKSHEYARPGITLR